ncbi:Eco57I restriction-modification methylase domain-containing protein [Clostridium akagii]|uniref:Eco57I restriction-modification methylase domain-containing protein n=1 Tax=Clostridium akagii TaxID=91623 RepID=UPI00055DDB43|nr:N-6 DNA methylase [Clostridium akagii]
MIDSFMEQIDEIYNLILAPIDGIYKKIGIESYKNKMKMAQDELFSIFYYELVKLNKENGVVYTPCEIADYIIKNTVTKEDIIKNPFIKIVDPACGSGNMLISCFGILYKIYNENLEKINLENNINLIKKDISAHIINNNLYGFDIDENALKILQIDLYVISDHVNSCNFIKKDFLIETLENKFDIYISNPPYVGHKSVDRDYSVKLKNMYKEIYKDKGDISYCFFQKSLLNLVKGGKLSFITSRYFLESPSGEVLRKILKELCSIEKIVDFYGIRPFKGAGIDPVIIFLKNEQNVDKEIEVIKPKVTKGKNKYDFYKSLFMEQGKEYNSFYIKKNLLNNNGWILRNQRERDIINKIEKNSFTSLSNICDSFQGIITGCDKAFIVDSETVRLENIETDLLRPWIKSSYISKYGVVQKDKYLIYSDGIENEDEYCNSIRHISEYKEKLLNRRECKNGIRKWYELQWGRNKDIFQGTKIVLPYKSENNRFALDKGSFFSADVYALILKESAPFTYEYLLYVLNSEIYEFYFKTFGKKLGENLYEYYPNNLMKLCIPTMDENRSEDYLYKIFNFTDEEIEIIKNAVKSNLS